MNADSSNPVPASPPCMGAAWAHLAQATVTARGTDAVRFVDNFTTASVRAVANGHGTEAFFTDGRGWVIALATILRTDAGLEIVTAVGLGQRLRDHLEHYHIREAVDLTDASADTQTLILAGPAAALTLAAALSPPATPLPTACLEHVSTTLAGHDVRIVRVSGQGADGFWIRGGRAAIDAVARQLTTGGVPAADPAALEAARIEAVFPAPGDIPEKTLPQELGRDARAISFTKGCYLGQETVARLDALGHVNRRLVLLAIAAPHPPTCPADIRQGDDVVGTLTSSCVSPDHGMSAGLALVRMRALAGEPLTVGPAAARVVSVPPAGATP